MEKPHAGGELNYDSGRREQPIGDDDVDRGKIDARNIFFAVGHEQIESTAYSSAEQDRRAQNMNPFDDDVVHCVIRPLKTLDRHWHRIEGAQ